MIWCFTKNLCTIRGDAWVSTLSWWSCQSPVAHSFSLLNHLDTSMEECSSLIQNLMQTHCSTYSVILNMMTTQYTRKLSHYISNGWTFSLQTSYILKKVLLLNLCFGKLLPMNILCSWPETWVIIRYKFHSIWKQDFLYLSFKLLDYFNCKDLNIAKTKLAIF